MPKEIREIITKAVIGKGLVKNKVTYSIDKISNVSSILGCWIINHRYEAELKQNKIYINGQFDLNIWYSTEDEKNSLVYVETMSYQDECRVVTKEPVSFNEDTILMVTCSQPPVCLEAKMTDKKQLEVIVEKTLNVDVVGETKISIEVSDEVEAWDEIDMAINPDFLEK